MAVLTRFRSPVIAGTVAALVLVLIFGSPWYRDWVIGVDDTSAGGWFAHQLLWPEWSLDTDQSVRDSFSDVLRALLVVALTGVFLFLMAVGSAGGLVAQVLGGWGAFVFGSAGAALLTGVIRSNPSLLDTLESAADGAVYGLYVGWLVGLATLLGRRAS